jgi:dihydropteroate synthase
LQCPILLGTSRKSFIGQILQNDVGKRLMGTAATVTAGVMQGAHIVRVHDVKAIKETLKTTDAILNAHT